MKRDLGESREAARENTLTRVRRERLLYVEDEDANWDVAELRLSNSFEMIRASTAEQACQMLRAPRSEIDIILMDIELRGSDLNGVELTGLLRGNSLPAHRSIPNYARNLPLLSKPVVYLTDPGSRYTNVQLMLSGADRVFTKPINFGALRDALSELLSERTGA